MCMRWMHVQMGVCVWGRGEGMGREKQCSLKGDTMFLKKEEEPQALAGRKIEPPLRFSRGLSKNPIEPRPRKRPGSGAQGQLGQQHPQLGNLWPLTQKGSWPRGEEGVFVAQPERLVSTARLRRWPLALAPTSESR